MNGNESHQVVLNRRILRYNEIRQWSPKCQNCQICQNHRTSQDAPSDRDTSLELGITLMYYDYVSEGIESFLKRIQGALRYQQAPINRKSI